MLDKRSVKIVRDFFVNRIELEPNFILPCTMFDPKFRKENNFETPLLSKIKPQYDVSGAYIFFEPCNQDGKIEVMYVGRSSTLRNRITGHWGNYTPIYGQPQNKIEEWFNYCWDNDYPYCPYVAIFISYGNLRDLEHWLMQLKPRFNIH